MFEKVTNILGDKISKKHLVYCFLQKFIFINIYPVRPTLQYENIADKLETSNLYFMIFIVQINRISRVI